MRADEGVEEPLLAERVGAEALDVGHVASGGRSRCRRRAARPVPSPLSAADGDEVAAPRRGPPRPRGREHEVRGADRRREAVVEGLGEPQRASGRGPSRGDRALVDRELAGVEAGRGSRPSRRRARAARRYSPIVYSRRCHGLSDFSAPSGARVSRFGVEMKASGRRRGDRRRAAPGRPRCARSSAGRRRRRAARRRSRRGRARSAGSGARSGRGVLVGVGVGVDPDHLGGRAGEHVGAVALAAGEVGDAHCPRLGRRSTRRRRGGAGTSSSPRARREACARRSAPAAGRRRADRPARSAWARAASGHGAADGTVPRHAGGC